MNGVLDHDEGYTGSGTILANEINFIMNHARGAGSIAPPVEQQSSALPLYHGCPSLLIQSYEYIFFIMVKC